MEKMAEVADTKGHPGLMESLKTHGLLQVIHLVGAQRYDDACKVVDILERTKAI